MVTVLTARVGTNPTRVKFGAIIFVLICLDGCWNTNTSTEPVKVLFCGRGGLGGDTFGHAGIGGLLVEPTAKTWLDGCLRRAGQH